MAGTDNDTGNEYQLVDMTDDEKADIDQSLVIQCNTCNSILGDSTSWVCANRELKTLSLQSVCNNVKQANTLLTSMEGFDQGSTYILLTCMVCKNGLGKMYKTTPQCLDNIRDVFTLDADRITSYQVGSADVCAPKECDVFSLPGAKFLGEQLRKAQMLILSLNDRLTKVERCMNGDIHEEEEEEEEREGNENDHAGGDHIKGNLQILPPENPDDPSVNPNHIQSTLPPKTIAEQVRSLTTATETNRKSHKSRDHGHPAAGAKDYGYNLPPAKDNRGFKSPTGKSHMYKVLPAVKEINRSSPSKRANASEHMGKTKKRKF